MMSYHLLGWRTHGRMAAGISSSGAQLWRDLPQKARRRGQEYRQQQQDVRLQASVQEIAVHKLDSTSPRMLECAQSCWIAGGDYTLPHGYWKMHTTKKSILCMTNELAEWNEQINNAAHECGVLASNVLMTVQEAIEQQSSKLMQVLDSLALLDMLSGFVSYMESRKAFGPFCRPKLSSLKGKYPIPPKEKSGPKNSVTSVRMSVQGFCTFFKAIIQAMEAQIRKHKRRYACNQMTSVCLSFISLTCCLGQIRLARAHCLHRLV
jgi:hypothetical protein